MNARHWTARRVGTDIRVRCMRDDQRLLEFTVSDTEARDLATQLEVARRIPRDLTIDAVRVAAEPIDPPSRL